ncbi:MAG: T9SS type A sorting domain-containing protein, partial [Saprospiraceae bacterium]|nr:T9SS type A sorting domain-containing protein [Saprospiraceae bacterium]
KYSNYQKKNASGERLPHYSSPTSIVIHDPNTASPNNFTGLILYPNPAKEMVFIKNNYNTFVQATLIDYLGKQSNISVTNNSFATDQMPNGAFIVKLRKSDGSTSIERLVIHK